MSEKSAVTRYGTVAITIHWLTAVLILLLFATGLQAAGQTDDLAKIALLRAHVPLGIGIFLLTIFRVIWWLLIDRARPSLPANQPGWQKLLARAVHIGLYVVVFVAAGSGIATIALSGAMPAIISGATLPDLNTIAPRAAHGVVTRLMLVLLALHVGAALYHQFFLRDRLLGRMGLGRQ